MPYPGVGTEEKNDEKVYHAYYQWVPFVLFLQVRSKLKAEITDNYYDFWSHALDLSKK